jgi:hypothetical protein
MFAFHWLRPGPQSGKADAKHVGESKGIELSPATPVAPYKLVSTIVGNKKAMVSLQKPSTPKKRKLVLLQLPEIPRDHYYHACDDLDRYLEDEDDGFEGEG